MDKQGKISLDNKTIAKLAMAIARAIQLENNGEVVGLLARKVLYLLIQGGDRTVTIGRGEP